MIEDNKNTVEDMTASDVSRIENQAKAKSAGKRLTGSKLHITDLANKAHDTEKKLVYQSHKIPYKIKILASNGLDLAKHPSRYVQLQKHSKKNTGSVLNGTKLSWCFFC